MQYELNGKKIRIPDTEISHYMTSMQLTKEEALQVWLEDEGYLDNEEQNALDKKAKENRITATIHQAKAQTTKTQRERVRKADPTKTEIITATAEMLKSLAEDVTIVNDTKVITFRIGADTYKFDLIRNRPPKAK